MNGLQEKKAPGSCRSSDATHKNRMTDSVQSCAGCQSWHKAGAISTLLATAAGAILVIIAVTHLHDVAQLVAISAGVTAMNGGAK
jgi:hypothetical protein